MFFGVSYGEVLVLLGAGAVLFGSDSTGPKDLPVLARAAGLLTGRAASYLSSARNRILGFAEQNEVTQLHQEVQESIQQLRAIRAEIRGGLNVFAPGPHASRLLQRASGLPASAALHEPPMRGNDVAVEPVASSANSQLADPKVPESQRELLATATDRTQEAQHKQMHLHDRQLQQQQQLVPLPVSAVAAGRARLGSEGMPQGSDIMADALAEEEVARTAQQFMSMQQQQEPP